MREAKNITIVGYSLPATDVYMQYFLKAAVGPNKDLNQITVVDPIVAVRDNPEARAMMERYLSCFSPPLQERVKFNPGCVHTQGFVDRLKDNPELFLF